MSRQRYPQRQSRAPAKEGTSAIRAGCSWICRCPVPMKRQMLPIAMMAELTAGSAANYEHPTKTTAPSYFSCLAVRAAYMHSVRGVRCPNPTQRINKRESTRPVQIIVYNDTSCSKTVDDSVLAQMIWYYIDIR